MPDDQTTQTAATVVIPDEMRAKYPELMDLILGSQSMNDGERQYWVNLIPIMTPEQIANLKSILDNEKMQLNAIDRKYSAGENPERTLTEIGDERRVKAESRNAQEESSRQKDEEATESILSSIEAHDS